MQSHPLITPKLITLQLGFLVLFILYSFFFNPPSTRPPEIPHKPLENLKKSIVSNSELRTSSQEFLISERRPGKLDHKRFFVKNGKLWGQLATKWPDGSVPKEKQKQKQLHLPHH